MHYKITPSLYNSWLFYAKPQFDRDEEQEKQARDEFLSVLRKEHKPDTEVQARGHNFENAIEYFATGKCSSPKGFAFTSNFTEHVNSEETCARMIATMCRDGVFQEKDGRELPSGHYVYGVADCILWNTIFDFKRVSNYEMGKYQKFIQHLAYMYIWNTKRFDYLVCDGSSVPFDEPYIWDDNSLALLESRIAEMIFSIEADEELRVEFVKYWTYHNKG